MNMRTSSSARGFWRRTRIEDRWIPGWRCNRGALDRDRSGRDERLCCLSCGNVFDPSARFCLCVVEYSGERTPYLAGNQRKRKGAAAREAAPEVQCAPPREVPQELDQRAVIAVANGAADVVCG